MDAKGPVIFPAIVVLGPKVESRLVCTLSPVFVLIPNSAPDLVYTA